MSGIEAVRSIVMFFGAGIILALAYMAGYTDAEKEREDEEHEC